MQLPELIPVILRQTNPGTAMSVRLRSAKSSHTNYRLGGRVFATQEPAHDPSSLIPIALVLITAALVFWRTVVKLLAIGIILLVVLGLADLLHSLH